MYSFRLTTGQISFCVCTAVPSGGPGPAALRRAAQCGHPHVLPLANEHHEGSVDTVPLYEQLIRVAYKTESRCSLLASEASDADFFLLLCLPKST